MEKTTIYYDTFCGHKVSDYGLENGRLDYATLSKCFDAVLCNNILEVDPYLFDNIESGDFWDYYYDGEEITREEYEEKESQINEDLEDLYLLDLEDYTEEEQSKIKDQIAELENMRDKLEQIEVDVFQWFIVSYNALDLLKEAGELVLYSEKLGCYVWGVTHWGTSWDYVLTSIRLRKREE